MHEMQRFRYNFWIKSFIHQMHFLMLESCSNLHNILKKRNNSSKVQYSISAYISENMMQLLNKMDHTVLK